MDLWFFICSSPLIITDILQYILDQDGLDSSVYKNIRNLASYIAAIEFTCSTYVLLWCNKVYRNHIKFKICGCFFKNQVRPFDT